MFWPNFTFIPQWVPVRNLNSLFNCFISICKYINTLQMDSVSVQYELLHYIYVASVSLGCGLCKITASKSDKKRIIPKSDS